MKVSFYHYTKKKNSTAYPSYEGYTVDCRLKENCSVLEPIFLIQRTSDFPDATYAVVMDTDNNQLMQCYFVTDIVTIAKNLFEIHCRFDGLASFKSSIGSSYFYVERAQSNYDIYIPDAVLSSKGYYVNSTTSQSDAYDGFNLSGTYLLTVSGGNSTASDFGVTTYACTRLQIINILDFIFNEDNFKDTFTDGTVKTFFNPFQYILSLRWMPFSADTFGSNTESVKLGWWDTGQVVRVVTSSGIRFQFECSMPSHVYTDFRRYSSYWTHHRVYLPGMGMVDVSANDITSNTMTALYAVDWITGTCDIRLKSDSNTVLAHYSGDMSVPVQISQNSSNILSGVGKVAGGITQSVLNPASIAQGISSAIEGVQEAMQPTPSSNGNSGNKTSLSYYNKMEIWTEEVASTDYATSQVGRPLCQIVRISSLSGYVKCSGASIEIAALDRVRDEINSFLNGGFIYE